jgi:hypothetical protein
VAYVGPVRLAARVILARGRARVLFTLPSVVLLNPLALAKK